MIKTNDAGKVATFIINKGYVRIGVDGVDGSGKSTIARKLAESLGVPYINLDDHLTRNNGNYLDSLRYRDIVQVLAGFQSFVIDGICLLNVLEKLNLKLDCLVYVKRIRHGYWANESECEVLGDVEDFLTREREMVQLLEGTATPPDTLGLAEEVIRYHAIYKPHNKADVIYTREDEVTA